MLKDKQKKFAEYYAESGNAYESAIKAGYSENYAKAQSCKLLENVGIQEYIRQLQETSRSARILSATQRQEILSDIAMSKAEPQDRIKAIDVLNKMTGEYINRLDVSAEVGVKIVDDITDN